MCDFIFEAACTFMFCVLYKIILLGFEMSNPCSGENFLFVFIIMLVTVVL
jgi:hypothetical protein